MQDVACQLGDLAGHLDARRAGADDEERQPGAALLLVCLDLGSLERAQDAGTEIEGALERLQLGGVCAQSSWPKYE